jgi:hypothetical protein
LGDAKVLLNNHRHDGAGYLCGVLLTHDLEALFHLANVPRQVQTKCLAEWSIIRTWSPATRYDTIGSVSRGEAAALIHAAELLVKVLIP